MRLAELDPRWLVFEGAHKGFVFWCPHCVGTDKATRVTCLFYPTSVWGSGSSLANEENDWTPPDCQAAMVASALGEPLEHANMFVPCNKAVGWSCVPPPAQATFENISITPSLDASASGHWHGFIRNGEIT